MGGNLILAKFGFTNYALISLFALLANNEKSYSLARGSVPAPSISGMIFIDSGLWNRLVGDGIE